MLLRNRDRCSILDFEPGNSLTVLTTITVIINSSFTTVTTNFRPLFYKDEAIIAAIATATTATNTTPVVAAAATMTTAIVTTIVITTAITNIPFYQNKFQHHQLERSWRKYLHIKNDEAAIVEAATTTIITTIVTTTFFLIN
ncbi:hypothetical protein RhiirA4_543979 [Rhizophagus irregularis]|uniref:Uncharacterized protein n=1 Tax=Rhizophagus irregularis TaxID=588596 RepID=A0A2I1GLF3_9GLOM|nr:hypothetical protein RhiirA4_543979 [Rhizophagus irregularis]